MALISFKILGRKAIGFAEVAAVPRVMIIAGSNGVGKSTLLYAVKEGAGQLAGPTKLLYQGPHRVLRRTNVSRKWLGGTMRSLMALLGSGEVSGYEGLNFGNTSRTPDNVDEVGSTIKHTLGKIENKRQAVLADFLDSRRRTRTQLDPSTLPDVYEPLRELTKHLLPHLEFATVNFANEDDIKCYWTRKDKNLTLDIDIDDLSSGEKSIIVLFLPLLEEQILEKLKSLELMASGKAETAVVAEDRVFLVDEPEQHLHPDLQAKILTYIRRVSQTTRTQFVITTHSPTILDQAYDDELYLLSGPSGTATENQLKRIANSQERLEALKELTGSAYFLTTGRIIVCVEGEPQDSGLATDVSLLEMLYPRATAFTLVPVGAKSTVITTVQRLRDHVPETTFRIRVRGLIDADQDPAGVPGVHQLPVSMIENFLIDPAALLAYLTVIGVATFPDAAAVRVALEGLALARTDDEISLRVGRRLKRHMVRLRGLDVSAVRASHQLALDEVRNMLPDEAALAALVAEANTEVAEIISTGRVLARFRGKPIWKAFFQEHVAPKNISYVDACLGLAKHVAARGEAAISLDPVFNALEE